MWSQTIIKIQRRVSRKAAETVSFETEFDRLSSIVERLDAGTVPLEEMLKLYEEGMALAGRLKTQLSEAELRIEKLTAIHEESQDADTDDDY